MSNTISWRITVDLGRIVIDPIVDGRLLSEIVREYEASRGYEPAGGYGGLVPEFHRFGDLGAYLDGSQGPWPGERPALLACECGELGCWPLQARVIASEEHIRWDSFSQPHRPERHYQGLGPFEFVPSEYALAVEALLGGLSRAGAAQE